MGSLISFLEEGQLSANPDGAKKLRRDAAKYTILAGRLYKNWVSSPLLRCLAKEHAEYVMAEVHEGICRSHFGGRALAAKVIRARYY